MKQSACLAMLLLIVGCGAKQSGTTDEGNGSGETAETAPEPGPETEHDRLLRLAKTKRKECTVLMDHIEKHTVGADEIVKFDDASRFRELATKRTASAEKLGSVEVSMEELVKLRDRYATLHTDMAGALTEAADAKTDPARQKGIERYRKLQGERQPLLDEISAWCNEPIQE